jgi:hypothetical protein
MFFSLMSKMISIDPFQSKKYVKQFLLQFQEASIGRVLSLLSSYHMPFPDVGPGFCILSCEKAI